MPLKLRRTSQDAFNFKALETISEPTQQPILPQKIECGSQIVKELALTYGLLIRLGHEMYTVYCQLNLQLGSS